MGVVAAVTASTLMAGDVVHGDGMPRRTIRVQRSGVQGRWGEKQTQASLSLSPTSTPPSSADTCMCRRVDVIALLPSRCTDRPFRVFCFVCVSVASRVSLFSTVFLARNCICVLCGGGGGVDCYAFYLCVSRGWGTTRTPLLPEPPPSSVEPHPPTHTHTPTRSRLPLANWTCTHRLPINAIGEGVGMPWLSILCARLWLCSGVCLAPRFSWIAQPFSLSLSLSLSFPLSVCLSFFFAFRAAAAGCCCIVLLLSAFPVHPFPFPPPFPSLPFPPPLPPPLASAHARTSRTTPSSHPSLLVMRLVSWSSSFAAQSCTEREDERRAERH